MKCTASGRERTWLGAAWHGSGVGTVQCPDCGLIAPYESIVWVRANDLYPRAKTKAHEAPVGVVPGEYAVLSRGGVMVQADVR